MTGKGCEVVREALREKQSGMAEIERIRAAVQADMRRDGDL